MAATASTLTVNVISQERQLLSTAADSVTVETQSGQITILPNHLPLFSKLVNGELVIRYQGTEQSLAVSQGFLDMEPDNLLNIIVDVAKYARDISVARAEEAMRQAQETMATSTDKEELIMAEASLRQALLEIRIAQKTKRTSI